MSGYPALSGENKDNTNDYSTALITQAHSDYMPGYVPGQRLLRRETLDLTFDKTFPETDETDCVRNIEHKCYGGTRKFVYNCFSLIFGVIFSFVWGIIMAIEQFMVVWCVLPYAKILRMCYIPVARVMGAVLDALFGLCLSRIASKGATINLMTNKGTNAVNLVKSKYVPDGQTYQQTIQPINNV